MVNAARYNPAAHPLVRQCKAATSASSSATPAAPSSDTASARVSDRSPASISSSLPWARSRAVRSGGSSRPGNRQP
jgi:hypothetical protein